MSDDEVAEHEAASPDEETRDLGEAGAARQPTVALLGTGIMGTGMAHSILRAGIPLRVWNRTAEHAEPLADDGAEVAASVTEAVEGAALVVTMLTDADATQEVAAQAVPAMDDGAIWVQMGTVGVAGIERLVDLATEHQVPMVDAPVSGTRQPAEDGNLVVLAAAAEILRPRCQALFDAVGSRTVWVDVAPGAGSRLKLVVNDWLCGLVGVLSESVVLSEHLGLDPRTFLDAIEGGPLGAPFAALKGGAMVEHGYEPAFPAKHAAKDVALVLDAVADEGPDLPVTAAVHSLFDEVLDQGHGDQDMAVLVEAVRATAPEGSGGSRSGWAEWFDPTGPRRRALVDAQTAEAAKAALADEDGQTDR